MASFNFLEGNEGIRMKEIRGVTKMMWLALVGWTFRRLICGFTSHKFSYRTCSY